MVPIVARGGHWQVTLAGEALVLDTAQELEEIQRQIRNRGSYPAIVTPDELQELSAEEGAVDRRFTVEMTRSLDRGMDMADGKLREGTLPCVLNGGNAETLEIQVLNEDTPAVTVVSETSTALAAA